MINGTNTIEDPIFQLLSCIVNTYSRPHANESAEEFTEKYYFEMPFLPDVNQVQYAFSVFQTNHSYPTALASIGFSMPIIPDMISYISNQKKSLLKHVHIQIILFSYISWRSNPAIETVSVIISGLLAIIQENSFEKQISDALRYCFDFVCKSNEKNVIFDTFPSLLNFFAVVPVYAEPFQYLLPQYLKITTINAELKSASMEIINFINNIIITNFIKIRNDTATDLIYIMANCSFMELDIQALELFHQLSPLLSDELHCSITSLLATPLFEYIEHSPPFLRPQRSNNDDFNIFEEIEKFGHIQLPFPFSKVRVEGDYNFITKKTFEKGLDIRKNINFSEPPTITEFMPNHVLLRFNVILSIVSQRKMSKIALFEIMAKIFVRSKEHFFDLASMFIFLFRSFENSDLTELFWNSIFPTIIFDDRINIFQRQKDYRLIDQFRSLIFDTFKADGFPNLFNILNSFTNSPAIVAEIVHRVMISLGCIKTEYLLDQNFIQLVTTYMIYFQINNFQCDDSLISFVEDTRSSFFLLIMHIFDSSPIYVREWLSHMLFLPTFFSFFFEIPVRPIILSFIKLYIINTEQNDVFLGTFQKLEEIVSVMISQIPKEQPTDLACDLLQVICDFNAHKKIKQQYFTHLISIVSSSFQFLVRSEHCSRYFLNAVSFLSSSDLNASCFGPTQTDMLYSAALNVESPNPSPLLFSKLVQLIAGGAISSSSPAFFIKQSGILGILASIYLKSTQFDQVIAFIKALLEYSVYNVVKANEESFDVLVLEIINSLKDNEANKHIITKLLEVVFYMYTTISSKDAPDHLLSTLLRPFRRKFISPFEIQFAQTINSVIGVSSGRPRAFLPLNGTSGSSIRLYNLHKSHFPSSFLIVFWVYLDQKNDQRHTHIFELMDSTECGIVGFICADLFLVSNINSKFESTARFDTPITPGTWNPICLLFEMDEGYQSRITASFGTKEIRSYDFEWNAFAGGPVSITIGTSKYFDFDEMTTNNKNIEKANLPPAYISSFAIYPTKSVNEIAKFVERGPRMTSKDAILSLTMEEKNENLDFNLCSQIDGVSAEMKCEKPFNNKNFCDILINKDITKFIIPLFKCIDFQTLKGEVIPELPEHFFDILGNILLIDKNVQILFEEKKGFEIITYFLNRSTTYVPSYSTYLRIYSILPLMIPSLQQSILKQFLLNTQNFIKSSRQNQLRLSKHWKSVIFSAYPNSFQSFIPLIILIFEHFILNEIIVNQIRANLVEIVIKIAVRNLNKRSLQSIVMMPFSVQNDTDKKNIVIFEVICILESIVKSLNSAIFQLNEDDLFSLDYLTLYFRFVSPDNLINLLNLIVLLHRKKLIRNISLQAHIEVIINETSPFFTTFEIVRNLSMLIKNEEVPELISLCAFLAINTSDEAASILVDTINLHSIHQIQQQEPEQKQEQTLLQNQEQEQKPSQQEKFNIKSQSTTMVLSMQSKIWLVALSYRSSYEVRERIFQFLLNCANNDDYQEIAFTINIVCTSLGDKNDGLLRSYLNLLASNLLAIENDSKMMEKFDNFFQISSYYIMFRRQHISAALKFLIFTAPYASHRLSLNSKRKRKRKIMNNNKSEMLISGLNVRSASMMFNDLLSLSSTPTQTSVSTKQRHESLSGQNQNYGLVKQMNGSNLSTKLTKENDSYGSKMHTSSSFQKLIYYNSDINYINNNINNESIINNSNNKLFNTNYQDNENIENSTLINCCNTVFDFPPKFLSGQIQTYHSYKLKPKVFGFHFDKYGDFLDQEIAMKCLKLFDKKIIPFFLYFDLILCSILVKKNRGIVENHLRNLKITPSQIKSHISIIALIAKNAVTPLKVDWLNQNLISYASDRLTSVECIAKDCFEDLVKRKSVIKEQIENKIISEYLRNTAFYENKHLEFQKLLHSKEILYFETQVLSYHTAEHEESEKSENLLANLVQNDFF